VGITDLPEIRNSLFCRDAFVGPNSRSLTPQFAGIRDDWMEGADWPISWKYDSGVAYDLVAVAAYVA
jgi:hypothetical protein